MNCLYYKTYRELTVLVFQVLSSFLHLKVNKREHSFEFYYFLPNSVRSCVSVGEGSTSPCKICCGTYWW